MLADESAPMQPAPIVPPRVHPGATVVQRLIAAVRLDGALYADVSADRRAGGQALLVVLLSGICNGFGLRVRLGDAAMWAGVGTALGGWLLWTLVVWVVARTAGARQPGRSLLRALGFATAPGVFLVCGVIPGYGEILRRLVVIWLLAATVVAVQATYSLTRRRALAISLIAFVIYAAIGAVFDHLAA